MVFDVLSYEKSKSIEHFSQVSTLAGLALSTPYYETRIRPYRDLSERFFPSMRPINTMDYIYAK